VSPSGSVTIMGAKGDQHVVNGQRLKVFLEPDIVPIKYIDIHYLWHHEFIVHFDHDALKHIFVPKQI
jgi:hypothetical protein